MCQKGYSKRIKEWLRALFAEYESEYISIGENCLADDILKRFNMKSFSSPYASSRSNIEYILAFENSEFQDFLNPDFLVREEALGPFAVRNKRFIETENDYDVSCTCGFEFTHLDVFQQEYRETMQRRCNRLLHLRGKKLHMLYHHRYCETTNLSVLANHLNQLKNIYERRGNKVYIYCLLQSLVNSESERRVEKKKVKGIYIYQLYTTSIWKGSHQDTFWARNDNDLLEAVIADMKKYSNFSRKVKKVIVFGCGKDLDLMMEAGLLKKSKIVAFCCNDEAKWGETIYGEKIISPIELQQLKYDYILICTRKYEKEIKEQLLKYDIPPRKIKGSLLK